MFQKGNKYGNRFDSNNQPAKNGRKPSLYKVLKNITGNKVSFEMEKEDYYAVIRWVMERTPKQLKELLEKEPDGKTYKNDIPLWLINIISALNADARYGKTATVEMIFDRIFGKATQTVESEVNAQITNTNIDLSSLSTEELLTYNQLLDKINKQK